MKIADVDNLIWYIDESLDREDVSVKDLGRWLGENASNKEIPNFVWDFVNAIASSVFD